MYGARWTFTTPSPADVAVARREGLISPTRAIGALGVGLKHAGAPVAGLRVQMRLGKRSFLTDRGWRRLAAWQFFFGSFRQPASVLAVVPNHSPRIERLDPIGVGNSQDGEQAVIAGAGRTLRIFFGGGPAGHRPCDDSYSGRVRESRRAVAFIITELPVPAPPNTACAGVGQARSVLVRLSQPLGGRVLVNSTDGGAIPLASRPTWR